MALRVAYFTNVYPAVSHSFIRREILALERQGLEIARFALRGWDVPLRDREDQLEQEKTQYVLRGGALPILGAVFGEFLKSPPRFFNALRAAWRLSTGSVRPLPYHLIYLAEACLLVRWLRATDISHTHAHFGTNPAEILLLAKMLGGPSYSFTVHGPEEFDNPLGLHLAEKARHAAGVVAISSFARSQLYRWMDLGDWKKIHVVRCGVDSEFLQQDRVQVPDVERLVCVGRLCEQKGQLLLLDAVRRILDSGRKLELVLAGDGDMRPEVEERIKALALGEHVRITGWIAGDEVRREILAARALVIASFAEGLPVVLMEAMALFRPVVVTYIAGVPELVEHQQSGWVIPAGDDVAIAEAITACLDTPMERLDRMGEIGHERAARLHDVDVEAAKLRAFFINLKKAA